VGLVLVGLGGAMSASACAPETCEVGVLRCGAPPCDGICLTNEISAGFSPPLQAWIGNMEDRPACEDYGLEPFGFFYDDLDDAARCGACACGPSTCKQASITSLSTLPSCEDDGQEYGSSGFQDVWEWDGSCYPTSQRPPRELGSVGLSVYTSPCHPYISLGAEPDQRWNTVAVMCSLSHHHGLRCGPYQICFAQPPPREEGWRTCVAQWEKWEEYDVPCPPDFPEERAFYRDVDGCTDCQCTEIAEPVCSAEMSFTRIRAARSSWPPGRSPVVRGPASTCPPARRQQPMPEGS
jgi:hypothetical protein